MHKWVGNIKRVAGVTKIQAQFDRINHRNAIIKQPTRTEVYPPRKLNKPRIEDDTVVIDNVRFPADCDHNRLELARINEHERDRFVGFRHRDHKYFVADHVDKDGVVQTVMADSSTTTIIDQFKLNKFEPERISRSMPKSEYRWMNHHCQPPADMKRDRNGDLIRDPRFPDEVLKFEHYRECHVEHNVEKTAENIREYWSTNGNLASGQGSYYHRQFELFYNTSEYDRGSRSVGFCEKFHREYVIPRGLVPYRTEMVVHSLMINKGVDFKGDPFLEFIDKHLFCGSVDMIYRPDPINRPKEIVVFDWKFSKEMLENFVKLLNDYRKKRCKAPFNATWDSKTATYGRQANVYTWFLETFYGFKVLSAHLGIFHERQNDFIVIDIPLMREQTKSAMDVIARRTSGSKLHIQRVVNFMSREHRAFTNDISGIMAEYAAIDPKTIKHTVDLSEGPILPVFSYPPNCVKLYQEKKAHEDARAKRKKEVYKKRRAKRQCLEEYDSDDDGESESKSKSIANFFSSGGNSQRQNKRGGGGQRQKVDTYHSSSSSGNRSRNNTNVLSTTTTNLSDIAPKPRPWQSNKRKFNFSNTRRQIDIREYDSDSDLSAGDDADAELADGNRGKAPLIRQRVVRSIVSRKPHNEYQRGRFKKYGGRGQYTKRIAPKIDIREYDSDTE